jgi:hypothetical protein
MYVFMHTVFGVQYPWQCGGAQIGFLVLLLVSPGVVCCVVCVVGLCWPPFSGLLSAMVAKMGSQQLPLTSLTR